MSNTIISTCKSLIKTDMIFYYNSNIANLLFFPKYQLNYLLKLLGIQSQEHLFLYYFILIEKILPYIENNNED